MTSLGAPPDEFAAIGPVDAPRRVRQRHIRRGWVGVGVLAIVLAALGSATLFRAIGPSQSYLALARDVPVGAQLTSQDLRVVRLNSSPGLSPVPERDVAQVIGAYAAVPLVAGTLLSMDHLTDEPVPGPGEQLVAIGLSPERLPSSNLRGGQPVLLVATSRQPSGDSDSSPPRTFPARVHEVRSTGGRSDDVVVSLLVDERHGAVVASLAVEGRLTLVLVAEGHG